MIETNSLVQVKPWRTHPTKLGKKQHKSKKSALPTQTDDDTVDAQTASIQESNGNSAKQSVLLTKDMDAALQYSPNRYDLSTKQNNDNTADGTADLVQETEESLTKQNAAYAQDEDELRRSYDQPTLPKVDDNNEIDYATASIKEIKSKTLLSFI